MGGYGKLIFRLVAYITAVMLAGLLISVTRKMLPDAYDPDWTPVLLLVVQLAFSFVFFHSLKVWLHMPLSAFIWLSAELVTTMMWRDSIFDIELPAFLMTYAIVGVLLVITFHRVFKIKIR